MPRANRRRDSKRDEHPELDLNLMRLSIPKVENKRGVEYQVREITGSRAEEGKTWVCPECSIVIEPGTRHTVAWGSVRGSDTRRHFHNHCWKIFNGTLL